MTDVVIIGGGPAGLTAAIYTSRREMKTVLISRDIGGQMSNTSDIENFPGFDQISGIELAQKMMTQAQKFGTDIQFEQVKKIEKNATGFTVSSNTKSIETRSIILAFGKSPRELGVPGEDKFKGRGVSYCATCDAACYRDKIAVIAGGGNSAIEAAVLTAKFASKVYVINKNTKFNGEQVRVDAMNEIKNIEVINNDTIIEITGDQKVSGIKLKSGKEIATDGIIVEIGYVVDHTLAQGLIDCDEANQIIINPLQETSVAGIFAAGDLTTTKYKQIVISAGEGAKAALSCYNYIQKIEGKATTIGDWIKKNK
ncbi:MAG: FAD-dependent oxidoreductase [Candidatus Berkelbacteria bacterium]